METLSRPPETKAPAYQATSYEAPAHYVEFRVADNGLYGHSYIAYGRLNAVGQPASAAYADIHPTGSLPSLLLGHFIPMDAATTPARSTPRRKVASRYRRLLSAPEYQKLIVVIARVRAEHHEWSIAAYNCNDFVAEVARGLGLQTPSTLSLPYEFIPELRAMNEPASQSPQESSRLVPPARVPQASEPPSPPNPVAVSARPAPLARAPRTPASGSGHPVPPAPVRMRQTALVR